jgi:diaminohydroxyphosphoribosylaminopyrimidine deaminase/5-amino-6-(5-phosphoribosylamino)uracil reductase
MSLGRQPSESDLWERAAGLALRGRGLVSPNPMVGAVLVRDGEVIGEGWHRRHGDLHAEREAIAAARRRGEAVSGATMFVTLEPCAHTGSQPPCADALIEAGVAEVVIACADPTAKTAGVGPRRLEAAGIAVRWAEAEDAAGPRELIQDFLKMAATGRPYVVLKLAMTLDGMVATSGGDSKWISGPESRAMVHRWRADLDAVAVGSGTAAADDPSLSARLEGDEAELRQPARVIFDSSASIRPDAAVFAPFPEGADPPRVIIVAGPEPDPGAVEALESAGVEVLRTGAGDAGDRFREAIGLLGARGVSSLLVEGGPTLAGAAVSSGEVDRFEAFVAPLLLGGGRAAVDGPGPELMAGALEAEEVLVERVGQDVHMSARLKAW